MIGESCDIEVEFIVKKNKFWLIFKENQLIKFLLVGIINTLFGYSIFALLILLEVHYLLASLLSTIAGILFNFKTIGTIVFKNKDKGLIFKFFMVYTAVYLFNISFLRILNGLNINMYFSGGIVLIPLALISFILNKKFVFGVKK